MALGGTCRAEGFLVQLLSSGVIALHVAFPHSREKEAVQQDALHELVHLGCKWGTFWVHLG